MVRPAIARAGDDRDARVLKLSPPVRTLIAKPMAMPREAGRITSFSGCFASRTPRHLRFASRAPPVIHVNPSKCEALSVAVSVSESRIAMATRVPSTHSNTLTRAEYIARAESGRLDEARRAKAERRVSCRMEGRMAATVPARGVQSGGYGQPG